MSRTRKDSIKGTRLQIVKKDDGRFDLWINRTLDHAQVVEDSIPGWLCVRFGFCGEEYTKIMSEVHANGVASVEF